MKLLSLSLTDGAASDILEQADWYKQRADTRLSIRWERSVYQSIFRLLRNPRSGSLCFFKSPELRAIRRIPVSDFPKHLIFYRIEQDRITILRIVHGARDLESLF